MMISPRLTKEVGFDYPLIFGYKHVFRRAADT
jgi:hypothetical protein